MVIGESFGRMGFLNALDSGVKKEEPQLKQGAEPSLPAGKDFPQIYKGILFLELC